MRTTKYRGWLKTTLLLSGSLALFGVGAADVAAQPCDYPLFITQGSVEANVLFLFDNSGSMNEAIWSGAFDETITYGGGLCGTCMYYIGTTGTYTVNSRNALLVVSDGGQSGRYWGNYLNWVFYHASDAELAALPAVTRVQVAKASVNRIVSDNPNIRFGVMQFNLSEGGSLVSPLGTSESALIAQVNGIVANTWTPIAESMVTALEYFSSTGGSAPIEYKCQKNFLVIVSDGFPTQDRTMPGYISDEDGDGNEPGTCASIGAPYGEENLCSDYMDDVAYYMLNNDLRSDLDGDQNVVTYAIGFGIDAQLFQETADNGGGIYLNADNPAELQGSLESVLTDIVNRISSGSAVAVVSTEGESKDLLFRGKFMPNGWRGFLEAFTLPYEPGETTLWEAGSILADRDPATRMIFTADAGAQIDFDDSNASDLLYELSVANVDSAAELINWVRGEDVTGYRDRSGWPLGDIIDSSPLVVGAPASFYSFDDYVSFRSNYEDRTRVVYIGSNDGMVHCFRESDGYELWAFIPPSLLGRLQDLADRNYCHEYFVNLTPRVADVLVNGAWRTVLIGGLKQGGGAYYALDVTYPESPQFMWESELPDVISSWASPEVVRVASEDKFVAFVGSGPDYANGTASLVAIDMADGSEVWSTTLSTGSGMNMSTSATAIDVDFDGYEDLLYTGDLEGNLWRTDLTVTPWTTSLLFSTSQPIQARPVLTVDYNDDVFIYFGTGRYVDQLDISDTEAQSFYCVIDNHSGTALTSNDLVDQTNAIGDLTPTDRGWFFDIAESAGERIVEPAALVSGNVYFTSFAPTDEACTAGGYSWLYAAKYRNGASSSNDDDTTIDRVESIGEGVTTKPVIDIINEKVIIQGSDTRIHVKNTKGTIRQLLVRSWRQIYQ